MGHVASIVSNLSNARKDFQGKNKKEKLFYIYSFFYLQRNWML